MSATVLVVDDSRAWRDLVCVALQGAGYQHVTAGDGKEALEVLAYHDVDLILTDLWMEGMDGLGLVEAVKSKAAHKHIPILAITTDATKEKHDALRRAGALMVIQKPFTLNELIAAVGRALGTSSAASQR